MTGRPINEDRQNAIALGLQNYVGAKHARCGTSVRYVAGGGCVHCARIIATEQREARKFLRQQSVNEAQGEPEVELDIAEEDGLDADEAEARRQASIDELM